MIQRPYHPIGTGNQFFGAIKRVFQFVNHQHFNDKLSLSKSACCVMNDMMIDVFQKVLTETQFLMLHQKRRILTSQALDDAVKLLTQHENFAHRCQFYARRAVCGFYNHK